MKKKPRIRIKGKRPKVLLIGNGIAQTTNQVDWDDLVRELSKKANRNKIKILKDEPEPLKVSALAGRTKQIKLNNKAKRIISKNKLKGNNNIIREMFAIGFTHILTTNYTYELENSLLDEPISDINKMYKYRVSTNKNYSKEKYNLHSYNNIKNNKIWHIHGEIRKPSSIILNYQSYAMLISKMIEITKTDTTRYFKNAIKNYNKLDNWVDVLLFGDVYIVGLGLNPAEIDLWWLLERKYKYKFGGRTVFYESKNINKKKTKNRTKSKLTLLRLFDIDVRNLGFTINKNDDYKNFYLLCFEDIQKEL